jgi:hypothetical protein
MVKASSTTTITAGVRPVHRSIDETSGASRNVRRTAAARGTRTACAQYRTAMINTDPANVIQRLKRVVDSVM